MKSSSCIRLHRSLTTLQRWRRYSEENSPSREIPCPQADEHKHSYGEVDHLIIHTVVLEQPKK